MYKYFIALFSLTFTACLFAQNEPIKTAAMTYDQLLPSVVVEEVLLDKPAYKSGDNVKGKVAVRNIKDSSTGEILIQVSLVSIDGAGPMVNFVYDRKIVGPVDIGAFERKVFEFEYALPSVPKDDHLAIHARAVSRDGMSLSFAFRNIKALDGFDIIEPLEANLIVNGKDRFELQEGPTIAEKESVALMILLGNASSKDVEITPFLSLTDKSSVVVQKSKPVGQKTVIKSRTARRIHIPISVKDLKPNTYLASISLLDENGVSRTPKIFARYIVDGDIVSVNSVRTNAKEPVKAEDIADVAFIFTGKPIDIRLERAGMKQPDPIIADVDVKVFDGAVDKKVVATAELKSAKFPLFGMIQLPLKFTAAANNLFVRVSVAKAGNVLSTYEGKLVFDASIPELAKKHAKPVESAPVAKASANIEMILAAAVAVVLVVVLLIIFAKKNSSKLPLLLLIAILGGSLRSVAQMIPTYFEDRGGKAGITYYNQYDFDLNNKTAASLGTFAVKGGLYIGALGTAGAGTATLDMASTSSFWLMGNLQAGGCANLTYRFGARSYIQNTSGAMLGSDYFSQFVLQKSPPNTNPNDDVYNNFGGGTSWNNSIPHVCYWSDFIDVSLGFHYIPSSFAPGVANTSITSFSVRSDFEIFRNESGPWVDQFIYGGYFKIFAQPKALIVANNASAIVAGQSANIVWTAQNAKSATITLSQNGTQISQQTFNATLSDGIYYTNGAPVTGLNGAKPVNQNGDPINVSNRITASYFDNYKIYTTAGNSLTNQSYTPVLSTPGTYTITVVATGENGAVSTSAQTNVSVLAGVPTGSFGSIKNTYVGVPTTISGTVNAGAGDLINRCGIDSPNEGGGTWTTGGGQYYDFTTSFLPPSKPMSGNFTPSVAGFQNFFLRVNPKVYGGGSGWYTVNSSGITPGAKFTLQVASPVTISANASTVPVTGTLTFTAAGGQTGQYIYNIDNTGWIGPYGNSINWAFNTVGSHTVYVRDIGNASWMESNIASIIITAVGSPSGTITATSGSNTAGGGQTLTIPANTAFTLTSNISVASGDTLTGSSMDRTVPSYIPSIAGAVNTATSRTKTYNAGELPPGTYQFVATYVTQNYNWRASTPVTVVINAPSGPSVGFSSGPAINYIGDMPVMGVTATAGGGATLASIEGLYSFNSGSTYTSLGVIPVSGTTQTVSLPSLPPIIPGSTTGKVLIKAIATDNFGTQSTPSIYTPYIDRSPTISVDPSSPTSVPFNTTVTNVRFNAADVDPTIPSVPGWIPEELQLESVQIDYKNTAGNWVPLCYETFPSRVAGHRLTGTPSSAYLLSNNPVVAGVSGSLSKLEFRARAIDFSFNATGFGNVVAGKAASDWVYHTVNVAAPSAPTSTITATSNGITKNAGEVLSIPITAAFTINSNIIPAAGDSVTGSHLNMKNPPVPDIDGLKNSAAAAHTKTYAAGSLAVGTYTFHTTYVTQAFSSSWMSSGDVTVQIYNPIPSTTFSASSASGLSVGNNGVLKVKQGDTVTLSLTGQLNGDILYGHSINIYAPGGGSGVFKDGGNVVGGAGTFGCSNTFNSPASPAGLGTYTFKAILNTQVSTGGVAQQVGSINVEVVPAGLKINVAASAQPVGAPANIWFSPSSSTTKGFTIK